MISAVPEREAGTRAGTMLLVVAAVVAVAGVVLLVVGLLGIRDAADTRDRATAVRLDARTTAARTQRIEGGSDSPITKAETVATSVADIVDAGDTVIERSQAASDVLGRAVDLANGGNIAGARGVYGGEAVGSVQQAQTELARAQAAQAAAQQAADALLGGQP
jgi:hypothetical protein